MDKSPEDIAGLVARLDELSFGNSMMAEVAHRASDTIRALDSKLREAVEVIQHIYDFGLDRLKVERFIATMEKPSDP